LLILTITQNLRYVSSKRYVTSFDVAIQDNCRYIFRDPLFRDPFSRPFFSRLLRDLYGRGYGSEDSEDSEYNVVT